IFSIAFHNAKHGVVAGGDYRKEKDAINNLAVTGDGGITWTLVKGLSGFRSVVAYVPNTNTLIALGPSGGDYSTDDGRTWNPITGPGFDTFSFVPRKPIGWASGAQGSIARLTFTKIKSVEKSASSATYLASVLFATTFTSLPTVSLRFAARCQLIPML
ncbi:MAG TPA: hypothetical protein VEV42_19590, partial [Pyrinomonadaceae bacterium]|nr:hypothetical protein [Pyrinomonadaceae bacterium]